MVIHNVVLQLRRHLRMATLVLADVGQCFGPTQNAVVQARENVTLPEKKSKRNDAVSRKYAGLKW